MEESEKPNVTRSFKVSGMPMKQWLIWKSDCIDNFGDCHWLKLMNDHTIAQQTTQFVKIWERIDEIEAVLRQLNEVEREPVEEKEEKEKVKTFGNGGN